MCHRVTCKGLALALTFLMHLHLVVVEEEIEAEEWGKHIFLCVVRLLQQANHAELEEEGGVKNLPLLLTMPPLLMLYLVLVMKIYS